MNIHKNSTKDQLEPKVLSNDDSKNMIRWNKLNYESLLLFIIPCVILQLGQNQI